MVIGFVVPLIDTVVLQRVSLWGGWGDYAWRRQSGTCCITLFYSSLPFHLACSPRPCGFCCGSLQENHGEIPCDGDGVLWEWCSMGAPSICSRDYQGRCVGPSSRGKAPMYRLRLAVELLCGGSIFAQHLPKRYLVAA